MIYNIQTDALEGFDKPLVSSKGKNDVAPEMKTDEVVWSEEFMQQASREFERSIRSMLEESTSGENSEFAESLLKVSQEAAARVFENQADQGVSFADTLRHLAEGTESLQVV